MRVPRNVICTYQGSGVVPRRIEYGSPRVDRPTAVRTGQWPPARRRGTIAVVGVTHDLPRGTVTFLFTDIEGSARLLKQLGDRYGELLEAHRRLLREAAEAHDGRT